MDKLSIQVSIDMKETEKRLEELKNKIEELKNKISNNPNISNISISDLLNVINSNKVNLMHNNLSKNLKVLNEAIKSINNHSLFKDTSDILRISHKNIFSYFMQTNLALINLKFQEQINIYKGEELIEKSDEEIERFLLNRSWFLFDRLDIGYLKESLGKIGSNNVSIENLNTIIENYFKEENFKTLDLCLSEWNHLYLEKRKNIFSECIWAIKNNKFTISLPALYAQLEGIVRDLEKENRENFKERKEKLYRNNYIPNFKGMIEILKIIHNDNNYINDILEFILDNVFANFDDSKLNTINNGNRVFTGNRNEIMHGKYIDYGYLHNSLRAFFFIDFFHSYIINFNN